MVFVVVINAGDTHVFPINGGDELVFGGLVTAPRASVHLAEFLFALGTDAFNAGNLFCGEFGVHFVLS
jgi:hypothetical protein